MKTHIGKVPVELHALGSMKMEELFKLAGYDYSKFDTAVPQAWFDAKLSLGIKDHYGWYYGATKDQPATIMGRPLGLIEVLQAAWNNLYIIELRRKHGTDTSDFEEQHQGQDGGRNHRGHALRHGRREVPRG